MANCGSNIFVEWVTGNETDPNILVAFLSAFAEFLQKFARAWARAQANVDDECPKRWHRICGCEEWAGGGMSGSNAG